MIVGAVEIQKLFIGKLRNILRIAAGFHAVGIVREKMVHNFSFQHLVRGRKCAFHLIVYNTIVCERAFLLLQMVIPSFLAENLLFLINIRVKNSVQIHMHQVLEILVIAACHRITGLVRIGHGIQEGIQRALYQLYKWILQRKLAGTAQNAVFQNMRNTGAVLRRGTKGNGKYLILIIILDQNQSGSCFLMANQISGGMDIGQILLFQNLVCRNILFFHFFLQIVPNQFV